jgi:hypothetical protein
MRQFGIIAVLALSACGGDDRPPCELASSDVRVDKAGEGDQVESGGTLMCVSGENVSVLWIDDRNGVDAVWFNASGDGGVTWKNADIQVNQGEGNVFRPALGCDGKNVYVAWEDDRDGELQNHNIYFQRSTDVGETWQENDVNIDLDEDGRTFSQGPFISVAGTAVYVAWFDNANGAYDIYLSGSSDEGATFNAPVRVDSDQPAGIAYSAWPQVVAGTDGSVVVAWEDARSGKNDIYVARSENGGVTFNTDIRLDGGDDPGSHNSFSPKIGRDGENVYVVWHDARNAADDEGARDIYANFSADGGRNWLGVANLVEDTTNNAPGFFNSRFPVVAVKAGKAVVAWEDARNDGYDIYTRVLDNGAPIGPETRLDGGNAEIPSPLGASNSLDAHIASSGSNVIVLWTDDRSVTNPDDGFSDLYYNYSSDFGTSWGAEDLRIDNVEAGQSFKQDLNLALVGETLFAGWTDGRTGSADIYTHTMKMGENAGYVVVGEQDCVLDGSTPQ